MRKIIAGIFALMLIVSAALGVSATSAPSIRSFSTVTSDGTCQVNMTVTLLLDDTTGGLTFPVPENAYQVTVNGSRVRTHKQDGRQQIDLSSVLGEMTGSFSAAISYSVGNTVSTLENGILQLQLPLLSGFAYSVDALEFSVTLPGDVEALPSFSSGYHQTSIEKDLSYAISGATISGRSLKQLKDHETLTMTLTVTEQMFPNTYTEVESTVLDDVAMGICVAVALIYWLAFLRVLPVRRERCAQPPEGFGAGELGSILNSHGADLTLMVLSWAQLGYVFLEQDRRGRVIIYRRMDMGNERSAFEQRCFRDLFRRKDTVDTSSLAYATMCRSVAKAAPALQFLLKKKNGNVKVFRMLAALAGTFGGISLGIALSGGAVLQWIWILLLAILATVWGWIIQNWGFTMRLWNKQELYISLAISGVWLLLSLLAGEFAIGALSVLWQWCAGFLAAFGGRRTELGKQMKAQVIGLRHYMKTVSRAQMQSICVGNPEYYFSLVPYAIALDVDQAFAKQFGKDRLPECPWLVIPREGGMTAQQWNGVLRQVARDMDQRNRHLPLEKFLRMIGRK